MPPPPVLPTIRRRFRGTFLIKQLNAELAAKLDCLERLLGNWRQVVILFSGGLDSTLLLKAATEYLGRKVVALTFQGPQSPAEDLATAREIAELLGVRHHLEIFDPFNLPDFRQNTPKRCYVCKQAIYRRSLEMAAQFGGGSRPGRGSGGRCPGRPAGAAGSRGIGHPQSPPGGRLNQSPDQRVKPDLGIARMGPPGPELSGNPLPDLYPSGRQDSPEN